MRASIVRIQDSRIISSRFLSCSVSRGGSERVRAWVWNRQRETHRGALMPALRRRPWWWCGWSASTLESGCCRRAPVLWASNQRCHVTRGCQRRATVAQATSAPDGEVFWRRSAQSQALARSTLGTAGVCVCSNSVVLDRLTGYHSTQAEYAL